MKNPPSHFPPYILMGIIVFSIFILSFSFLDKKISPTNDFILRLKQKLSAYNHYLPQEKVYLHFDKPFYIPGDDIWFSAYLRKGNSNRASKISEILYVELINPKGNIEKQIRLVTKNGRTHGDFRINNAMPGGMYKVRAYTNWMKNNGESDFFEKELQVQAVILPRLLMKLDFERKAYGAGDEVVANITLSSLTNEPLKNFKFDFISQLSGKPLSKGKGQTDENGIAHTRFTLPKNLDTNDGLLNIMTVYEGSQESISRSIPIVLNNIDLQFFPEGGDLIQGVESRVAFKALNEFGKPADIEGIILDANNRKVADLRSFHQGMGAFTLKTDEQGHYSAKITKPEGIAKIYPLPSPLSKGYRLMVTDQQKQIAKVKIHSPFKTTLSLIAQVRGEIYYASEITANPGDNLVSIPLKDFPAGIAEITLFDDKAVARCERLLFVNQHQQLQVEISTDKEKYLPREKVEITVKVSDENGLPVPGQFSLSVVDDKLISFADDKQATIMSYLLLNSDLKGQIEEPNFYFDKAEPKAAEALNYLLMTQGWRKFSWEEILESNEMSLVKGLMFAPEKAIVKGKVIRFKEDVPAVNARITVLETEEVTFTDKEGKFEFKDLDLSTPRTLQVLDAEGKERLIQVNNYAQEYLVGGAISGKVVSKNNGEILPGVTVTLKGTSIGTVTNINGEFTIPVTEANSDLMFHYIGFQTQEISALGESQLQGQIQVELDEDFTALQEMAVTGYAVGNRRQRMRANTIPMEVEQKADIADERVQLVEEEQEALAFGDENQEVENREIQEILFQEVAAWEKDDTGNAVFTIVENMPEYPGGMDKLHSYFAKNIEYPKQAKQLGIEGKVYVQFIIMEDGTVAEAKVVKGIGAGCDEEALRVVKNLPRWRSGEQGGQSVRTRMVLPISYNLEDHEKYQSGLMFQVASNANYGLQEEKARYYPARKFYTPVYKSDEAVETRTDFRNTIYWNPNLNIDKTGATTVSFYNSDEVTAFRATLEGLADDGLIGRAEHTYFTQLPFSMDTKIPAVLAFEDKIGITLTLKNNINKSIEGILSIEALKQLRQLSEYDAKITIPANSVKTLVVDYEVLSLEAGTGNLKFTFESEGLKDSFEQEIEIKAKGFPAMASFSGNESNKTYELEIKDIVENSLSVKLTAYPDVLSDLMSGIQSILQEPYGCFEQNSSSTYPNILVLNYLETSGTINPQAKEKAEALIKSGYQKLVTFETKDKGYEWFGSTPPHEGLTAYGLMEFKDMQKVYASVDKKMVQRTADWLLERRNGKGGFHTSGTSLDQFGRASEAVSNAYIVYALSEADYNELDKEIQLSVKTANASNDAYQMALVSNALFNLGKEKEADQMLKKLTAIIKKEGVKGLKSDHSITRSTGKSLQVETASLVLLAMLQAQNKDLSSIQETVQFLVESRSNHGGFGSTQATILALKGLTQYASFSKRTASSGTIEVLVDGKLVASQFYEKGTQGEIIIQGLEKYIREDSEKVSVNFKGTVDPLPYSLDLSWSTYTPVDNKECKIALQTSLKPQTGAVGETMRLTAKVKNTTQGGLPMTIALIGIPSGLSIQPWQLKELLDKKIVDFYEVDKNYLVLYYRQMAPGIEHVINLDLKTEIRGTYEAPASSAYLYYTNEHKVWAGGENVHIR